MSEADRIEALEKRVETLEYLLELTLIGLVGDVQPAWYEDLQKLKKKERLAHG